MRVLMISRDKNIFKNGSEVRQRMFEYGKLAEKLRIMVLSRPFKFLKIGKEIKGFDLITTQDPFECGLFGYAIARILKIPLQLQIHTDFMSPYFGKESLLNRIRIMLAKFLIPRANCVRVVSERIKKSLPADKRVTVLPIFINIEKIKDTSISIDLHKKYPQFNFIILMASRLTKEKNIKMAIDALPNEKIGLIIVGAGPEKNNLKLRNNVIIEPWTNNIVSYYKTCDLFLLTSNYEGYGRTLVEAAAAGCNIISSNVGIAEEILEKENIFKPGDVRGLEEKIIKIIKEGIKPAKPLKIKTKEEYMGEIKRDWENCASCS